MLWSVCPLYAPSIVLRLNARNAENVPQTTIEKWVRTAGEDRKGRSTVTASGIALACTMIPIEVIFGAWLILSSIQALRLRRNDPALMSRSGITRVEAGVRIALGFGFIVSITSIVLFALLDQPDFENTLSILMLVTSGVTLILATIALMLATMRRKQQR